MPCDHIKWWQKQKVRTLTLIKHETKATSFAPITLTAAWSRESWRTDATITFTGESSLTSAVRYTSTIATRTLMKQVKRTLRWKLCTCMANSSIPWKMLPVTSTEMYLHESNLRLSWSFVLVAKSNSKNTCVPWYVNPVRGTKSSGYSTSSESLISHRYWWLSSRGPTLKDKQVGSVKHLMLQMSSLVVLIVIITWLVRARSWAGWEYFSRRHSWAETKWNAERVSKHLLRVGF